MSPGDERAVHGSFEEVGAEVAASLLRANGVAARVVRDPEVLLGVFGQASLGGFVVLVPTGDEQRARDLLDRGSGYRRGA